jgi:hypothetical protein
VGSFGRAIKNTGKLSSIMGRPDGNIGRPDDARAKALSLFFSRGAFGRACRRGSRDFWCPDKTANGLANKPLGKELILQHSSPVRTAMNPIRTLVVEWLFSFHFAHEH